MLGKCLVVCGIFTALMYTVTERNCRIREITSSTPMGMPHLKIKRVRNIRIECGRLVNEPICDHGQWRALMLAVMSLLISLPGKFPFAGVVSHVLK